MKICKNCENTVDPKFARVFGSNDDEVFRCLDCIPDDEDKLRHLNSGAAARSSYEIRGVSSHKVA